MATVETIVPASAESVFDIGDRVVRLLKEAQQEAGNGAIPESMSARLADSLEALWGSAESSAQRAEFPQLLALPGVYSQALANCRGFA